MTTVRVWTFLWYGPERHITEWRCTCGARFVDSHHAITVTMPSHTALSPACVIRKLPISTAADDLRDRLRS